MPVYPHPGYGFTLTCPDNATLVPVDDITFGAGALAVPDNCESIVVYNMDAGNRVFLRFGLDTEVTAANTTVLNSTVLPASASMTFQVGYVPNRAFMGGGSVRNLYLLPEAGANLQINITYLMGAGRPL